MLHAYGERDIPPPVPLIFTNALQSVSYKPVMDECSIRCILWRFQHGRARDRIVCQTARCDESRAGGSSVPVQPPFTVLHRAQHDASSPFNNLRQRQQMSTPAFSAPLSFLSETGTRQQSLHGRHHRRRPGLLLSRLSGRAFRRSFSSTYRPAPSGAPGVRTRTHGKRPSFPRSWPASWRPVCGAAEGSKPAAAAAAAALPRAAETGKSRGWYGWALSHPTGARCTASSRSLAMAAAAGGSRGASKTAGLMPR